MGKPAARGHFHIGKSSLKRGILGGTGIDTKADSTAALVHMTDAHLTEMFAVPGALDAVVIFPSAESVPHCFNSGIDGRGSPVGITQIGDHAA